MMHFSLVPYKIAMAALRLSDSKTFHSGTLQEGEKKEKGLYEIVFQAEILYCLK